jgi:hypothetical protein
MAARGKSLRDDYTHAPFRTERHSFLQENGRLGDRSELYSKFRVAGYRLLKTRT